MSTYFVDTSGLAKRYLIETGSSWVLGWIEPTANNVIVIAELAMVEMRSVFARRVREGILSAVDAAALRTDFLAHVGQEYLTVYLDSQILSGASSLVDKYTLRTLDAIQLACAVHASSYLSQSMMFISADNDLLKAAASEGFAVDNPNNYP